MCCNSTTKGHFGRFICTQVPLPYGRFEGLQNFPAEQSESSQQALGLFGSLICSQVPNTNGSFDGLQNFPND